MSRFSDANDNVDREEVRDAVVPTRRRFLTRLGKGGAAVIAAGLLGKASAREVGASECSTFCQCSQSYTRCQFAIRSDGAACRTGYAYSCQNRYACDGVHDCDFNHFCGSACVEPPYYAPGICSPGSGCYWPTP